MKHSQILDLRVIVQNCKIGTSTLMTSTSSDVAWKMTSYRAETSAEVCHFQILAIEVEKRKQNVSDIDSIAKCASEK